MSIPVQLHLGSGSFSVSALIDSGAAGNFMDLELANQLQVPLQRMDTQLKVKALDGRPLGQGTISKRTVELKLQVDKLAFLILESPDQP